jgi:dTDP-4-amino-4,6-dideoxygalactose transaminase
LIPKENESRYYSDFPIQVKSPLKDITDFFKRAGIEVIRPFAKPLHQIMGLPLEDFCNTEHLYLSTLLIPINSNLMKKDVMHISKNLSVIF